MENMITIKDLTFEYVREEGTEPVKAIDDVSLEIAEGSFTAIIGKNGSGKSTLAKNLNGLLTPTEGVIYVGGYDTRDEEHIWADGRNGFSESGQSVGIFYCRR